jgi:hypothetical protein
MKTEDGYLTINSVTRKVYVSTTIQRALAKRECRGRRLDKEKAAETDF